MGELVSRGGRCRHLEIAVARPLESVATLRRERFDVLIDTGPWPRFDAILAALAGARFTIGFSSTGHARHFAFDLVVPHARGVHEMDNFRALIHPLGASAAALPSLDVGEIPLPAVVPQGARVVFHPWSGGFRAYLREWEASRWVELAGKLGHLNATILLSGSPADAPRTERLAAQIRSAHPQTLSIAGLSITEMIPVLQGSALVVGVNTSVTHMASVLGAPTVMLQGPTSHRRWGPLGSRSRSVESDLPGCGYVHHGFEFEGQREDCMEGVRVDAVLAACNALLA
jgi:ADP-heptose:LPS heptosyltransferase